MSHQHTTTKATKRQKASIKRIRKQIAKGQNAENPIGSADVPSSNPIDQWDQALELNLGHDGIAPSERCAALAAYLRTQACAFVGREHPARNALFAFSIVAACCDGPLDLKHLREAIDIANACLRRFGA